MAFFNKKEAVVVVVFCIVALLLCMLEANPKEAAGHCTPEAQKMCPALQLLSSLISGDETFDVIKFGAVADGKTESSKAFLEAWEAACSHSGSSSLLVPKGQFLLGPINLTGPCYKAASLEFIVRGIVKAPADLAAFTEDSWIVFRSLNGLTVRGGGIFDGQGTDAWKNATCPKKKECQLLPRSLRFIQITNASIHDVQLLNSKSYHVSFYKSQNVTVYNLSIIAPGDSPNTDGIHVSKSTNITITNSIIGVGDDCISVGDGNNDIYISGIFCGPGHGISIGSLGKHANEMSLAGVHVTDCSLHNTTNGVRIKSWPDSIALNASNFIFKNIIMDRVSNPILIDQNYCPYSSCEMEKPSHVQISHVVYQNITGTTTSEHPVSLKCSADVPCQDIQLIDIDLVNLDPTTQPTSECSNVEQLSTSGKQNPPPCKEVPEVPKNLQVM